jgi:5-formyltetrahydrofolate cyclo-ligase
MVTEKSILRKAMRAWRREHWRNLGAQSGQQEKDLAAHLLPRLAGFSCIGGYAAMPGELPLTVVLASLQLPFALPALLSPERIEFRLIDPKTKLVASDKGFMQPATGQAVVPDCLLVPLLGVDRQGNRLGQGAGHYDHWLAATVVRPYLIGIAFDAQVIDSVPSEPHDVPLDAIATPGGWIDCRAIRSLGR